MKEYEIRPKELFDAYLAVSKRDIAKYFNDQTQFSTVPCPACLSADSKHVFNKHEFDYVACENCQTLYVSPRPSPEQINEFYKSSESSEFWAERFFPETAVARMEKIFKPRAAMIRELLLSYAAPAPISLADVGAGIGLFLDAMNETGICKDLYAVEPGAALAEACRKRGYSVYESPIEQLTAADLQVSAVASFEVFEHLYDPYDFVQSMARILKPGGLLIFTTLSITGFDLQVLGKHSKSISPPHHINFFSYSGFQHLIERCGLELVDIRTPGQLDVDIVKNMLAEDSSIEVPDFVRTLLEMPEKTGNHQMLDDFQKFLTDACLSSHACVVARKI